MKVTVYGVFLDENMPPIRQRVDARLATGVVHGISRQFAGLKCIEVHGPEGTDLYSNRGAFIFGVPK